MKINDTSDRYRMIAEINVIPLIDVALVLLLIFMIVTPFLVKSQININLPTAKKTDGRIAQGKNVDVQVRQDGAIFVAGSRVEREDVESALLRVLPDPENQPVIVEADKDTAFQHVIVVLDAAKRIGAARLAVCVKEDKDRRSGSTGRSGR